MKHLVLFFINHCDQRSKFWVLDRRVSNELSNFLQLDPFGVRIGTSYKKTSNFQLDLVWNANSTNQLDQVWNELELVDLMDFRTSSWEVNLIEFGTSSNLSIWWTLERVGICRFDGLSNELEFVDLIDLRTSPELTDFQRPPNASFETFWSSTPKFWPLIVIVGKKQFKLVEETIFKIKIFWSAILFFLK